MSAITYAIEVRGQTHRYATLAAAQRVAAQIFRATGDIVGIIQFDPGHRVGSTCSFDDGGAYCYAHDTYLEAPAALDNSLGARNG
jgi:hypothetical protein